MSSIYINGLSGKMGITLKNLIKDEPNLEIVETVKDSDLIIDFSRPESTMLVLQEAQEQKKPIIIGTTGFNDDEVKSIDEASKNIPILLSFNMSKGIFYFKKKYQKFFKR